jgi:hypothetical protein
MNEAKPSDRSHQGFMDPELMRALIDELRPTGECSSIVVSGARSGAPGRHHVRNASYGDQGALAEFGTLD